MNALARVGEVVKAKPLMALAQLGGGVGSTLLGYYYVSSEVDWFQEGEYAWLKRAGILGAGTVVGAHLLLSRSMPWLSWGFKAGGLLVALWEVYQRFFKSKSKPATTAADVAAAAQQTANGAAPTNDEVMKPTGRTRTIGSMLNRIGRLMPMPGDGADRFLSGTQGRRVSGTVAVRSVGATLAEQAAARGL